VQISQIRKSRDCLDEGKTCKCKGKSIIIIIIIIIINTMVDETLSFSFRCKKARSFGSEYGLRQISQRRDRFPSEPEKGHA